MKRHIVLAVMLAIAVAACGGGPGVAASVNGTDITVDDVESLIQIDGATIAKDQFAQFLGFQIQWTIVKQGTAARWGIDLTEAEITAEADRIFDEAGQGESREEFTASRGVTEDFLRNIAHQSLLEEAVREALRSEIAVPSQDEIDAARPGLTEVCVTHILVATEAEAEAAMERIDGGEGIGSVAAEISTDPGSASNDGILPCGPAGDYVAEFRDAALVANLNEVYDEIVETQFGFHILLVTDRTEPTQDEVIESLTDEALATEVNAWYLGEVEAAEVTVDSRYGTWQTTPQPGVVPPSE